jgi:hypothetical protein
MSLESLREAINNRDFNQALSLLATMTVNVDISEHEYYVAHLRCYTGLNNVNDAKTYADKLIAIVEFPPEPAPFTDAVLNFIFLFDFSDPILDPYKNFMETTAKYDRCAPGSYYAYKVHEAIYLNIKDFYSANPTYVHYDALIKALSYKDNVPATYSALVTAAEDFLLKLGRIN